MMIIINNNNVKINKKAIEIGMKKKITIKMMNKYNNNSNYKLN